MQQFWLLTSTHGHDIDIRLSCIRQELQDTHQKFVVKPVLPMNNLRALKCALEDAPNEVLGAEACVSYEAGVFEGV
jgi:hypothetical protein